MKVKPAQVLQEVTGMLYVRIAALPMKFKTTTSRIISVLFVMSTALPSVYAGSLWDDFFSKIPLIQNQFYVNDLAKFGAYVCGFLLGLGVIMYTIGYAFAGDRPEAAGLLKWGKRLIVAGFLGVLLLGVIPYLIDWFRGQVNAPEVPTWGGEQKTISV
jgi:hypothetical protein